MGRNARNTLRIKKFMSIGFDSAKASLQIRKQENAESWWKIKYTKYLIVNLTNEVFVVSHIFSMSSHWRSAYLSRRSAGHLSRSSAHLSGSSAHLRRSSAHLRRSSAHLRRSSAHLRRSSAHLRRSSAHLSHI